MAVKGEVTTYGTTLPSVKSNPHLAYLTRQSLAEKFAGNLEYIYQQMNQADAVAVCFDLDGVIIDEYDEDGRPHLDGNITSISPFVKRARKEIEAAGKKFQILLNTNREVSIVEKMMSRLDPNQEQQSWWTVLEGGHTLAYRTKFNYDQCYIHTDEDGTQYQAVRLTDGGHARIYKTYDDGSAMVVEELIKTSTAHQHLKIGPHNLSLGQTRKMLVDYFARGTDDGSFQEAYIPDGRFGMVTIRNIDESLVRGKGISSLDGIKKYPVPADAPIAKEICKELGIQTIDELPAQLFFYSDDKGFDIQFDGFSKSSGQRLLYQRMRELGVLGKSDRFVVGHIGDSGSDKIGMQTENDLTAVIAVGNADSDVAKHSIAQTHREYTRGVKHILYILQQLAMGNITQATIEKFKNTGGIDDFIKNYLGRDVPQEGDIDVGEVLRRADQEQLSLIRNEIVRVREQSGRVFFIGNGGSFDNARLAAQFLREAGIDARTPGDNVLYKKATREHGYPHIFVQALEAEGFTNQDLVIGISGSGNSPNVLLAEEHAQRVRIEANLGSIQLLREAGYNIDASLLTIQSLRDGNDDFDSVAGAVELFEKSLEEALQKANERNDQTAAAQIQAIQANKTVISLGGRDGGKMKRLTSEDLTHIAPTSCMEALEDEHPLAMAAIAESIRSGMSVQESIERVGEIIESMREPETLQKIVEFGEAMEEAIFNGGRVVIVGNPDLNASVTHAHADWGRGMINMLPINGPEVSLVDGNINAMMATGNDDGSRYVYADQMGKIALGEHDVVVFIGPSAEESAFEPCMEMATTAGAHTFVIGTSIGDRLADVPQVDEYVDLAATSVTHTISRAVNEHMRSPDGLNWTVDELQIQSGALNQWVAEKMGSDRKLDAQTTLMLENALRNGGQLELDGGTIFQVEPSVSLAGNVITWCYGKAYLARDPADFSMNRGFY